MVKPPLESVAGQRASLKRTLTLPLLSLYGLGTILGAGIYVLVGEVAAHAGLFAPISFLVAALLAALMAFSFAELSARIPKSAGEAAYVKIAFGSTLATVVGLAVVLVGSISAATIAVGFRGYLQVLIDVPDALAVGGLIVVLGFVAALGVNQSVGAAAVLTVIEIAGLILVLIVAGPSLADLPERMPELVPSLDAGDWPGILLGAFVAFYAFIGFEDMVNMAEEVKRPERTLPRSIVIALVASTLLYVSVSLVCVLSLPTAELAAADAPLVRVYESASGSSPLLLTIIGLFAVSNGALIQIIMGSRILYGLSEQRAIPTAIGRVNRRTRTPVRATLLVSGFILSLALLFPLASLAQATTFVTLAIFSLVNLALLRIKRRTPRQPGRFAVPLWVPIAGFVVSSGFIVYRLFRLYTDAS